MQPENEQMFLGEQGQSQGQGSNRVISGAAALTSYRNPEARYFHRKCWSQA